LNTRKGEFRNPSEEKREYNCISNTGGGIRKRKSSTGRTPHELIIKEKENYKRGLCPLGLGRLGLNKNLGLDEEGKTIEKKNRLLLLRTRRHKPTQKKKPGKKKR